MSVGAGHDDLLPQLPFERDGFYFVPAGVHVDGGGDFTIYDARKYMYGDAVDSAYIGYLCFTEDKNGEWRGRFTQGDINEAIYTRLFDDVLRWLAENYAPVAR